MALIERSFIMWEGMSPDMETFVLDKEEQLLVNRRGENTFEGCV